MTLPSSPHSTHSPVWRSDEDADQLRSNPGSAPLGRAADRDGPVSVIARLAISRPYGRTRRISSRYWNGSSVWSRHVAMTLKIAAAAGIQADRGHERARRASRRLPHGGVTHDDPARMSSIASTGTRNRAIAQSRNRAIAQSRNRRRPISAASRWRGSHRCCRRRRRAPP